MYLEVYPDVIFVLNFIIDFILLYIVKKVNRKRSSLLRLILAATIGASFTVLLSVFPWWNILLKFLLMNVVCMVLMILAAFGKCKKADFVKQVIVLYLITYFAGGLLNSIYYYTNFRYDLLKLKDGIIISNISWKYVIIMIMFLIPAVSLILWLFRWYHSNTPETYEVELEMEDRSICTRGLMDTGNCLHDPILHKPVMVMEDSLIKKLLTPEFYKDIEAAKNYMESKEVDKKQLDLENKHLLRLRFIPYQSVGKAGMMLGLVLDKVIINTGKESICHEKVTVAICDQCLSTKASYHVILHKELL